MLVYVLIKITVSTMTRPNVCVFREFKDAIEEAPVWARSALQTSGVAYQGDGEHTIYRLEAKELK